MGYTYGCMISMRDHVCIAGLYMYVVNKMQSKRKHKDNVNVYSGNVLHTQKSHIDQEKIYKGSWNQLI